jgi:hypothetical protein
VTAQPRDSVDVGTSFAVWPPPTVSRVDPFHFGIRTGADKPRGPRLNPYVERDIDHHLQLLLEHHQQAIVVSASHGAGAARTVYEALKRVHPRARLLIPMPPGEFAPEVLSTTNIEGSVVLWLDTLGSYWGVEGARLFEVLSRWVRQPDRWLIATVYDGDPDVFASKEFDLLNARVLRLDSELTSAELDRMHKLYGDVKTTASIGSHPPVRNVPKTPGRPPRPEPPPREHVRLLDDEPVGLTGDRLDRKAVANAVEKLLSEHVRSFRGQSLFVHVDGAWGAGKSSLLRFLRESVEESWLVGPYDAWRQSRGGPRWPAVAHASPGRPRRRPLYLCSR